MFTLRTFSRSVTHYVKQSSRQLHTTVRLLSVKGTSPPSSSSSSDSSDSDSDKDAKKPKDVKFQKKESKENFDSSGTNERLAALLNKISQGTKSEKTMDIAIKVKKDRFRPLKADKKKQAEPFEEKLIGAAKAVAKNIKGDSEQTELELLSRVLNIKKPDYKTASTNETKETGDLSTLLAGMRIDKTDPTEQFYEKRKQVASRIIRERKSFSASEDKMLEKSRSAMQRAALPSVPELNTGNPLGIFSNLSETQLDNVPKMSTWQVLEEREIRLTTLTTPQNVYQELIQWTEEGKLWKFPINNEQGLEEEEKTHFSEHVFLERHLKDWCPKRGPIRHFMELVCTGLSMNHWFTVKEKHEHLEWYKNFFMDKKELLHEIGALDDKVIEPKTLPPPSPSEKKETKEIET